MSGVFRSQVERFLGKVEKMESKFDRSTIEREVKELGEAKAVASNPRIVKSLDKEITKLQRMLTGKGKEWVPEMSRLLNEVRGVMDRYPTDFTVKPRKPRTPKMEKLSSVAKKVKKGRK